jgi:hypothetical protein
VNHFSKKPVDDIPTTGVACLTFSCQKWDQINQDNLDSEQFFFPGKEE